MAEPFLSLIQSQRMSQVLAPQLRQSLELKATGSSLDI